jgi:outer membrane receptor protein involved in Fe transport
VGLTGYFIRSPHNFTFGADYKRLEFNSLSQQNARGSFGFTGAATGSDFGDFLTGVPDTSTIAFGNADKYFRSNIYDAYLTDDWRVTPGLTLNIGMRYEYSSPISEIYGRLVNLDVTPGFENEAPVIGYSPNGSLTGQKYPASLVRPDKTGFEPRIGLAWRPISGSSLVVRAGYGVNYNTSVYQSIASQMAQQSPLSKSLSVSNSPANPLTLANGFNASAVSTPNTFGIDPNFRIGYTHSWQVSIQRDLPGSLILNATYLGIKGTRGTQEFYPNTYPNGATNPCPACPVGYLYMTSNGNSIREQGNVQLRRRLHNGLTATLVYTYAKSIDDAVLGGRGQGTAFIAQNWLDLSAERALSTFDQRHLLNFQMQYTTGVGTRGGTLLDGWRGTAFKEWTITTAITAGSGMPLSPVYFSALNGTSCTTCTRPNYTGASLYAAPPGLFLNPAAYTQPAAGQFGNAGRDTIEGPDQFTLNASMQRTWRYKDRYNLDIRLDATNALNHVTYTSWVTTITSPSFGSPAGSNQQRVVQATLRMRF